MSITRYQFVMTQDINGINDFFGIKTSPDLIFNWGV